MPPLRPVRPLEELTSDWLAGQLWHLCADGRPPAPALAFCGHLQRHLAPPLQRHLSQRLERWCSGRPAGPLLSAAGYLLGGHRLQLRLEDLSTVCQLSAGGPPPAGGPRALSVRSDNPLWDEQEVAGHAPSLGRVLTDFSQLVSLELTNHCTNELLDVVGRCCRRLVKLRVELAMADNEGVRLLLGLPDDVRGSAGHPGGGGGLRDSGVPELFLFFRPWWMGHRLYVLGTVYNANHRKLVGRKRTTTANIGRDRVILSSMTHFYIARFRPLTMCTRHYR